MKIDMYKHIVAWCPCCGQDWVVILKEFWTDTLFCYCDECMSEWDTPFQIERGHSSHEKYGRALNATDEEIENMGWTKYLMR